MSGSSPFASKFNTNFYPTDEETDEIRALLIEPLAQLISIDEQIASLLEQRKSIAAYVALADHQALIAPLRRLPTDILEQIFLACLPADRLAGMISSDAPLLLSQICGEWRRVALSLPRLWSRFQIEVPTLEQIEQAYLGARQREVQWRLETTKLWLERSHSVPLSLSMIFDPSRDTILATLEDAKASHAYPFFVAVISAAERWRDVAFTLPELFLKLPEFDTVASTLRLSRLALVPPHYVDDDAVDPDPIWTRSTPILRIQSLRELKFGEWPSVSPFALPVNWAVLTSLDIALHWLPHSTSNLEYARFQSLDAVLAFVLSACPELVQFHVKMIDSSDYEERVSKPDLEAKNLRVLVLDFVVATFAPLRVLTYLSLPQLRVLRVLTGNRLGALTNLSTNGIRHFFTTSSQLENLWFEPQAFSDKTALEAFLLALPPSLKRLRVWLHPMSDPVGTTQIFDDEMLDVLVDPALVPALEVFSLKHVLDITEETILRFLQKRCGSDSRLKSVQLEFVHAVGPSDGAFPASILANEHVQALVNAGVDIELRYPRLQPLKLSLWTQRELGHDLGHDFFDVDTWEEDAAFL
ncbi:F-box domain-containing protein [Mycena chlorophos]|uniref:F-box domain-containing protein n=1 Tax=Mycena chlorophos TaxID=658473 RepID=A0A8H6SCZ2_MYCCL|nr:F-box domain-containing protein [Mycena chlorophos]